MKREDSKKQMQVLVKEIEALLVQISSNSQNYNQQHDVNTEVSTRSKLDKNQNSKDLERNLALMRLNLKDEKKKKSSELT